VNNAKPNQKKATASRKQILTSAFFKKFFIKEIFVASLAVCATLSPVAAQETNISNHIASDFKSSPAGIWANDVVGDGFRRGLEQSGFAIGAGFAIPNVGDKIAHNLALSRIYFGWMLGNPIGENKWYRGNFEIVQELFGGGQFCPTSRYAIGETTLLRYNFATGTRWVPFLDLGGGVLGTDIGPPDLGTTFEFNEQFGPGVNFFWRKNSALTFQYRYTHFSNAGIREPNQGVNEQMFYAGMTWFF
jgi:lipid A 3-O-deacylase